jgi:hypothetical protein
VNTRREARLQPSGALLPSCAIRTRAFHLTFTTPPLNHGEKRHVGRIMSFDPMAAAVDWLDAYRDGDIETILAMYADDAVVHCGCGGMKTISGRQGLWE